MLLESHFDAIEQLLLAQSNIAQNAGHNNLKGGPREWFIREFLADNLPSILEIGQGEIIDQNSEPNPSRENGRNQVDAVIYSSHFPKLKYSINDFAFLIEGVLATIEVKSVLNRDDFMKACIASGRHKSMGRGSFLNSYLITYKCDTTWETISDWLISVPKESKTSIDKCIDIVVILGKGIIINNATTKIQLVDKQKEMGNWLYIPQNKNNIYGMFAHMLSWAEYARFSKDVISGYFRPFIGDIVKSVE